MADHLSGVDLFVTVVEAGSYSLAAERLDITRSAVGKGIARLELRLGVQLFHRSTRKLGLTDEGTLYFRHCLRALEEIRAGEFALEGGQEKVYGRLRISMPVLFGHMCIAPILLRIAEEHEALSLDLSFSDRTVDLVEEGFDLVIRNGFLPEKPEMATRRLGEHGMAFCASETYLRKHGVPVNLEELKNHHGVAYTRNGQILDWRVIVQEQTRTISPKARLQMDDLRGVADAAIAGFGIAWLPSWLAHGRFENGELVEVLPEQRSVVYDINAIWPHTAYLPRKTRTVIAALEKELPERLAEMGRQAAPSA